MFCAIGAYSVNNRTFDVTLMLVFGVIGYMLKKCNYPLAPLVLAIVLGDKAEEAFRQSLLGSQGSFGVFFSNGLVGTIMALGFIALFWPLIPTAGLAAFTPSLLSRRRRARGGKRMSLLPVRCGVCVQAGYWNIVYQT